MLIKTRNFSLSKEKQNGTFDKGDGLGWAPGYEGVSEGTGVNTSSARYAKNYAQMQGLCEKCSKFNGTKSTDGSHCALPANERCEK